MKYKHVISLGYFCSVALEIERLGLRDGSYPFDWLISSWAGVEALIKNHFKDFLNYDFLAQYKNDPSAYLNEKYGIAFYHDFDKYKTLESQLPSVVEKYERRINRFYKSISEPTLFIRYISSENGTEELEYLENHIDEIMNMLKSYNAENDIIWIANSELKSSIIKLYVVEKDINEVIAKKPLEKNAELYELLSNIQLEVKSENLAIFEKKQRKKNSFLNRNIKILRNILKSMFFKKYIHSKVCDNLIP